MTGDTHRLWGGVAALVVLHDLGALHIGPDFSGGMFAQVATILGGAVLAGLPDVDLKISGLAHRTLTHSFFWAVLLAVLLPFPFGVALAAAFLTHPVLDALSGRVQFFWPLPWWVGVGLVKTGSIQETVFNVTLAVYLAFQWLRVPA